MVTLFVYKLHSCLCPFIAMNNDMHVTVWVSADHGYSLYELPVFKTIDY